MKGLLFFIIPILSMLCGCIHNFDRYSHEKARAWDAGVSQNKGKGLKFNGFYYRNLDTLEYISGMDWPNQVEAMCFYADGGFGYSSVYENLDSLISEQTRFYKKRDYYKWGYYKIEGDTIHIDFFERRPLFLKNAVKNHMKVVMRSNGISILKSSWDNRTEEPYIFKEFKYKPDSTKNWVINRSQHLNY